MQTVSIQLGRPGLETFPASPLLVSADAIGIELELEGFTQEATVEATRRVHPDWTIVPDGSLRNGGVEFITTGGLGGERLAGAIERIQAALEVVNYDASWRCSTHMHVNMLDFTVNQVVRFVLAYTACEPVLFEFCGAYRKSSNFCTPVLDSLPFHRKIMSRMWDDAVARRHPVSMCNKYVALNLLPLFPDQRGRALGTVEFRGGRPLVTREEMFTQANLLLSIKNFVRDFAGTEEEMLIALADGVHNRVFLNGVSAGIEPAAETLEQSLVAAWMMLKSYQEGMAQRAALTERQREFDEPETGVPSGYFQQVRANLEARTPQVRTHASNIPSPFLAGDFDSIEVLRDLFVAGNVWPSLHEQYVSLRHGTIRNKLAAAWLVTRQRCGVERGLPWVNAHRAILNWVGNLAPTSVEQSPISTLVRLRDSTIRNPRHAEPQAGLPGHPVNGIRPYRIAYQQELPEERYEYMLSRMGYSRDARNIDCWHYLADHKVRTKNRDALAAALADVGLHVAIQERMSTFQMYSLLRFTGRASADHVWSSDLGAYDNFCCILDVLHQASLEVPVVRTGAFSDAAHMYWSRVNGNMGLNEIRMSVAGATRLGQTPRTTVTGVEIY